MTLPERVALFERRALIRILRKAKGTTQAAQLAGYNRTAFIRLLNKHGLLRRRPSALGAMLVQLHRTAAKIV